MFYVHQSSDRLNVRLLVTSVINCDFAGVFPPSCSTCVLHFSCRVEPPYINPNQVKCDFCFSCSLTCYQSDDDRSSMVCRCVVKLTATPTTGQLVVETVCEGTEEWCHQANWALQSWCQSVRLADEWYDRYFLADCCNSGFVEFLWIRPCAALLLFFLLFLGFDRLAKYYRPGLLLPYGVMVSV